MGYIGNQQTQGFSQVPAKQDLTGATGTSLTLSHAVASAEGIDLFINNVRQEPTTAYSVGGDGVTVTLTGSVVASDDIYVVYNSLALQTTVPPDASVSTAKLAASLDLSGKTLTMPTGAVLQVVQADLDTFYSNLTNIPLDNTKPQITEGGEILTCSITPTSATSKLLIDVVINAANDTANNISGIFLFQDSNADALRSAWSRTVAANTPMSPMVIKHFMTAGTTSSTTFRVRGGTLGATSTFQVNGGSGVQYLGGSLISSITITEIAG